MEITLVDENNHDGSRNGQLLDLSTIQGGYRVQRKLCFPVNRSTGNFRLCQLCNGSMVHGSLRQHGKGNQMVNTPQLSMFIVTMEGGIVDDNV